MSWSSTGLAMSNGSRATTRRRARGAVVRIQPIRSPPHISLDADPTVMTRPPVSNDASGGSGGASRSWARSAKVSSATRNASARRAASTSAARSAAGMSSAGRVVEVGDRVGQPDGGLPHGAGDELDVPALVDPDGDQPDAAAAQCPERVRVGGALDHDGVARRRRGSATAA